MIKLNIAATAARLQLRQRSLSYLYPKAAQIPCSWLML